MELSYFKIVGLLIIFEPGGWRQVVKQSMSLSV